MTIMQIQSCSNLAKSRRQNMDLSRARQQLKDEEIEIMKQYNRRQALKEKHDVLVAGASKLRQTITINMKCGWNPDVEALKGELAAVRKQKSDLQNFLTSTFTW